MLSRSIYEKLAKVLTCYQHVRAKVSITFVKGSKKHPIYQFLTQKSKNKFKDSRVTWNFQKYLINTDGKIEKIISPRTRPDSQEIVSWITDGQ